MGQIRIEKNSALYLLILYIISSTISVSCVQINEANNSGIKLNYPLANYSGLGWLSQTKLAVFVADENGGVTGYYLESDDHFYSLDLPPSVAKLDCNGVNDFNNDINYTHPSLLPDGRLGLINSCVSLGDLLD